MSFQPRKPRKWGWIQDDHGEWFRELAQGQRIEEPPASAKGRRIYDHTLLIPGVPDDAVICPIIPESIAKCGWKQAEDGRWFRDIAPGCQIGDPPD